MYNKLILFILFPIAAYSQLDKDLQHASVYAQNNVLSRKLSYTNSASLTDIILVFDEAGRLKEEQLKHPVNRNAYQFKIAYLYNEAGQLIMTVDTSYGKKGMDIETCTYTYDKNQMKRRECLGPDQSLRSEILYDYHPAQHTEKLYRADSIYRTQTSVYDSLGYKVRFYGNETGSNEVKTFNINGKVFTIKDDPKDWNYRFVNEYENARLIRQTRYEGDQKKEYEDFKYNKKGLLKGKYNSMRGMSGSQEVFSYQFRK